jgi:hypothetical protein
MKTARRLSAAFVLAAVSGVAAVVPNAFVPDAMVPAVGAQAAPSAERATAPSIGSAPMDHALFDSLLARHVVSGLVDYDAFARAPAFRAYLRQVAEARPDAWPEDDRIAYWLNVYNAYTIQLIVSHGERTSIRNINRTLGVLRLKGPWSEPLVQAAGRRYTLDEVAHRILRRQFSEPRVHAAMTDAALGSPPLRSEAYTGSALEGQLVDQMRRFLGEKGKNRIRAGAAWLSPVFTAYRRDFGNSTAEFGEFLAPYFAGKDRELLQGGQFRVTPTRFDWALNAQRPGNVSGQAGH